MDERIALKTRRQRMEGKEMPQQHQTSAGAIAVFKLHAHPAVDFAAAELAGYLERMLPQGAEARVSAFKLGLYRDFGFDTHDLPNPEQDDAIAIEVEDGSGIIAGSNTRSVLFAVYRFLEELGCRWIRPGSDGECIPVVDWRTRSVRVRERAAYRHRGICIEGAVSFENMLENIDWAPKAGFNAYFLEFKVPFTFFDRWYSHRNNRYKQPEPVSVETVERFTRELEHEIKRRGLHYHAVGHGFTCEPFGLPALGWDPVDIQVEPETSRFFACVDGKRELWTGVPLLTNLCYSNPEARRKMVEYTADYLDSKPYVDYLHFWLADGFNNHCECDACRQLLPADFYIMMLNELDEELNRRGISTRIVFLLYLDLLWPPMEQRLKNPERFVLLFAPISRTYSKSYETDSTERELRPFERNRLVFPSGIAENYAFLQAWRRIFQGDSFVYEYYFMWEHFFDPGYCQIARILSEDIKKLRRLGLNGMISDQTQRSFFPTGLGMYVMGKTLWNDAHDFAALAKEYFASAFGEDGERCLRYMSELSERFDSVYLRGEKPQVDPEAAERYRNVRERIRGFRPVVERNLAQEESAGRRRSWEYMRLHAELAEMLALALEARASGDEANALAAWEQAADWVQRNEDQFQPVFDVYLFLQTWNKLFDFRQKRRSMFGGEVS
jgi:hypothetical protein